jgi:GntR family transcriptional regulator
MMAGFQIDVATGSGVPIYRQIVDQVRLAVATGALAAGEALPSVRGLAERLVVNPNTVVKAYGELVRDGVLESHPGRGVFVASKKRQIYTRAERLRRLHQAVDAFLNEAVCLDFSPEEILKTVDEKLAELQRHPDSAGETP